MNNSSFRILLDKYITHSITSEERKQLAQLLQADQYTTELETIIDQQFASNAFETEEDDTLRQLIFEKIQAAKHNHQTPVRRMQPRFVSSRTFKRIAVAASILLIVGLGFYFALVGVFTNKPKQETATQTERFKNDIDPGGYKARLTLADGRIIVLDSVATGELAKQGKTVVINKDGQLVYSRESGAGSHEIMYNTLSTARGETYATVLADGSKVWLNSASSIKYPVAFTGNERRVEITGEAYFEIAKDPKKKFIVSSNNVETEVLGTHFNVNAYDDESEIKITLLEGSVRVTSASSVVKIKPGEQAKVSPGVGLESGTIPVQTANINQVVAWKNGMFQFESAELANVMRQLSRWYDIEVINGENMNVRFTGEIPRRAKLTTILKAIELTGNVKFMVEGKKVTVMK